MNRILLAAAAVLVSLSGCASPARYVEKSGDVGVIAIPANTDAWPNHYRREAMALIERHVGSNFEIVEEKEVVVGNRTDNNQQVRREQTFNTTMPFLPAQKDTTNNVTTTQDVTEWRIAYRKRTGPMPLGYNAPTPTGGVTQTQYVSPNDPAGVQPAGGVGPASPNAPLKSFMGEGCAK
jgi:hypothetical protein